MYLLVSSAIDTRIMVLVAPLNYSCIIKMLIKLFSYRDNIKLPTNILQAGADAPTLNLLPKWLVEMASSMQFSDIRTLQDDMALH